MFGRWRGSEYRALEEEKMEFWFTCESAVRLRSCKIGLGEDLLVFGLEMPKTKCAKGKTSDTRSHGLRMKGDRYLLDLVFSRVMSPRQYFVRSKHDSVETAE